MTVSNVVTRQTYDGDGATVLFAIPFNFKSGDASNVTKVYLIDELTVDSSTPSGFDETLLTEGQEYTLNPAGPTPANVKTDDGSAPFTPSADQKIRVERRTSKTQDTDFDSGGSNTPYNPTNTENAHDKLTRILQEVCDDVSEIESSTSTTVVSSAAIPDWAPATNYLENQVVIDKDTPTNKIWRALSDHTSGGTFNGDFVGGKWELLPNGADGQDGSNGSNGADGADGTNGTNGLDGADGADGVFAAIASQAEAEAGVNNVKGMTALRTKQAIDLQVPALSVITTLQTDLDAAELTIQDHQNRIVSLEASAEFALGRFAGSQKIVNAQAAPLELLGGANPIPSDGRGSGFLRDGDGTEFAKVLVYIKRVNSLGDVRFTSFDLIMHYVDSVWYITRDDTVQLVLALDLDGIVLSVATDGITKEGQLSYTSDDMGGDATFHKDNSVIKWFGQEIPIGI